MKQVTGALIALALAAFGTAAQAGPSYKAEAVLAAAPSQEVRQIIDGRDWKCLGTGCRGNTVSAPKSQSVMRECRAVAAEFGELALYRSGRRELKAHELAQCNVAAKKQDTAEQMAERR